MRLRNWNVFLLIDRISFGQKEMKKGEVGCGGEEGRRGESGKMGLEVINRNMGVMKLRKNTNLDWGGGERYLCLTPITFIVELKPKSTGCILIVV